MKCAMFLVCAVASVAYAALSSPHVGEFVADEVACEITGGACGNKWDSSGIIYCAGGGTVLCSGKSVPCCSYGHTSLKPGPVGNLKEGDSVDKDCKVCGGIVGGGTVCGSAHVVTSSVPCDPS